MTEVYVKGIVEKIIFHNPDSMYYIASVEIKDTNSNHEDDTIVVTGNMVDNATKELSLYRSDAC